MARTRKYKEKPVPPDYSPKKVFAYALDLLRTGITAFGQINALDFLPEHIPSLPGASALAPETRFSILFDRQFGHAAMCKFADSVWRAKMAYLPGPQPNDAYVVSPQALLQRAGRAPPVMVGFSAHGDCFAVLSTPISEYVAAGMMIPLSFEAYPTAFSVNNVRPRLPHGQDWLDDADHAFRFGFLAWAQESAMLRQKAMNAWDMLDDIMLRCTSVHAAAEIVPGLLDLDRQLGEGLRNHMREHPLRATPKDRAAHEQAKRQSRETLRAHDHEWLPHWLETYPTLVAMIAAKPNPLAHTLQVRGGITNSALPA